MRRSSTLNLALVWAAAASLVTGVASLPMLTHHDRTVAATTIVASRAAPGGTATPETTASATPIAKSHVASSPLGASTKKVVVKPPSQASSKTQPGTASSSVPATTVTSVRPSAPSKSVVNAKPVVQAQPVVTPKPVTTPKPVVTPKPSGTFIQIGAWTRSIVVSRLSQAAINACGPAVVWWGPLPGQGSGPTWLAGHNYCGFAFWDTLSIGTKLTITDSAGTFTYRIVSRLHIASQGGTAAGILHDDLMLQTCTSSGTSITYADLIS